jgi:hypothetical protein
VPVAAVFSEGRKVSTGLEDPRVPHRSHKWKLSVLRAQWKREAK